MAEGARTILAILLLLLPIARQLDYSAAMSTEPTLPRVSKAVDLITGYMELVEEERCSDGVVRLTCRSLRAFVFVILAEYRADRTDLCGHARSATRNAPTVPRATSPPLVTQCKKRDVPADENYVNRTVAPIDLRSSLNRRCSGQHHCRYNLITHHPGAKHWPPASLRLKYACIPELAVRKYCNLEIQVPKGEGGYLKSPGYPLYYPGGNTCGWIFRTLPGQRIVLTFHDLSIRSPEPDGRCVDVIRVRENGSTLLEFCGTTAGVKLLSSGNTITLDLVASANLYPARGFFLRYQVLSCPDVSSPSGSYASDNGTTRTFLCREGTVFPDTNYRQRTVECKDGEWNETVATLPGCIATSAVILKSENDQNRLSSLSGDNVHGTGLRIGRGQDAVAATYPTSNIMDSAQTSSMKQADYVVDVVLPTVLIALLFVGNAIIVYIIFQYRRRKEPAVAHTEEMSVLRNSVEIPRV